MILYLASACMFLFVALNLFWRIDCSTGVKAAGCLLLLFISLKYEVYRFIGGYFFAPHLPRAFLLLMEALYGGFIILFFLLLLFDLYLIGNLLLSRCGFPVPKILPRGAINCGLAGLALALGIWGTWNAVKVPDVRTIQLAVSGLPAPLTGLRLVQLSDLHIGPILKGDWLAEVVAKTNSLRPDLILLTGDYVDGFVSEIGAELAPLADLKASYGVWAVTGNHEYYWNMPQWRSVLEKLNVKMLENEHKAIQINNETIIVAGIPDLAAGRFGLPMPDLAKALRGAPDAVRILLSHQPKHVSEYAKQVDLMLSGHTHGGLMFFLQPLVARFNDGFVNGLYAAGKSSIYVNPGTGLWNGFSSRIGVPSEITEVILMTADSEKNARITKSAGNTQAE